MKGQEGVKAKWCAVSNKTMYLKKNLGSLGSQLEVKL